MVSKYDGINILLGRGIHCFIAGMHVCPPFRCSSSCGLFDAITLPELPGASFVLRPMPNPATSFHCRPSTRDQRPVIQSLIDSKPFGPASTGTERETIKAASNQIAEPPITMPSRPTFHGSSEGGTVEKRQPANRERSLWVVHPRGDRLLERQTWQSLPGNGGIASKASYALASPCLSPIDLESRNETYVLSSRVQIVGSEEELNRIEMATIASLTRPHNHSTRRRMGEPRIRCNQTKPQNRPGLHRER